MRIVRTALLLTVAAACFAANAAMAEIEVLVSTGDAVPDGNGEFSGFGNPALNSAGQVVYPSTLVGTSGGQTDSIGLYRQDGVIRTQIARTGETFVGEPVIGFFPTDFYLDPAGNVVGTLVTGPPTGFRLFRGNGGPLTNLIEVGSASPTGNNTLVGVFSQVANDNGALIYRALYSGTNAEAGVYLQDANGTTTTLLLSESPAPLGGTFEDTGGRFTANESQQVATVANALVGEDSVPSLMRLSSSSIEEVVRTGDLLDDGITTIRNFGFRAPLINNNGAIAFAAEYEQPGLLPSGVFIADNNGTSLIAGRLLPGGTAAATDIEIFGFTDSGTIAFSAQVGFGFDPPKAIYTADSSDISLIALEETAAPGTDKFFGEFPIAAATSNANGDLAFLADLADTVDGSLTGRALFRYTESAGLAPVVQTGDALLGSTVTEIFYAGTVPNSTANSADESLNGMNDAGQIAFQFAVEDGRRGIALWTPDSVSGDFDLDGDVDGHDFLTWQRDPNVGSLADWQNEYGTSSSLEVLFASVPEPTSIGLLLLGSVSLGLRGKRRAS